MGKTEFNFCGLTLGLASGWDVDQGLMTFYDLEPSTDFISAFPRTAEYKIIPTIHFLIETGEMQITNEDGSVVYEQGFTIVGNDGSWNW